MGLWNYEGFGWGLSKMVFTFITIRKSKLKYYNELKTGKNIVAKY
jgi:hypothetical protein